MVAPVRDLPALEKVEEKKPRIVEIIGPAGAGKTTLRTELLKHSILIRLAKYPKVRQLAGLAFYTRYGLPLVPRLMRINHPTDRQLNQREFAWMSILSGWDKVLTDQARQSPEVIIIDQGPVYLFVELIESGPQYLRNPKAEPFWGELYTQWAKALDLIVWLDADDDHLMDRIRGREKGHLVKDASDQQMMEFLGRFRAAFNQTVSRLEACPGKPRILKFDTAAQSAEQIAAVIMKELSLE